MKIKLIGEPKIIMSNPNSPFNYFGWPTAARLKDGRIAVAASGFRFEHICPFGKCVISFSEDDGETFTPPTPVIDTILDDRDGGLCTFGESGVIITSFNNTIDQQKEWANHEGHVIAERQAFTKAYLNMLDPNDEGKFLGNTFRISNDNAKTFGEIYKSPVSSPHGPIELDDGTILWVGCAQNVKGLEVKERPERIQAYKIGIDGKCEFVGAIADIPNLSSDEPYTIQMPDGKLVCLIRVEPTFATWQSESYDNGKTWTTPRECLPENEGAPAHAMFHSSGLLIGAYSHRGFCGKPPYGIRIMFSKDYGVTWDFGHIIFEFPGDVEGWPSQDLGYPTTVELGDGSLLTVFYAHLNANCDRTKSDNPAVIYAQRWTFEE